jgi:hypothetical protein
VPLPGDGHSPRSEAGFDLVGGQHHPIPGSLDELTQEEVLRQVVAQDREPSDRSERRAAQQDRLPDDAGTSEHERHRRGAGPQDAIEIEGFDPRAEGFSRDRAEEMGDEADRRLREEGRRPRQEVGRNADVPVGEEEGRPARAGEAEGEAVDLRVQPRLPRVDDEDGRDVRVAVGDPPRHGKRRILRGSEGKDDLVERG